ncbi:glutathione hydrolase 1 proenzyme-like isoform X2 [Apostichopus japonicus]|uniref:glutathione hydrolase 1 proenzyme-like isoform X2 n=1 Tax=Stichopus japonicus TaxID=307972 RepID=UPI003AB7DBE3
MDSYDIEPKSEKSKSEGLSAKYYILIVCTALVIIGLIIGLGFLISDFGEPVPRSQKHFENAVVAADSIECSIIGRDMLRQGGSAADATVASLICTGLFNAQSSGIGGGVFILYYDRETQKKVFYNGRERAPLGATENMYEANATLSQKGGLAIGVPGEVKAFWELHKEYGKLAWKDLFAPSIKFAREGFVVPVSLSKAIAAREDDIKADPNMSEVFLKEDGELYEDGDLMTRPKLADTLQTIADEGVEAFYSGSLADNIIADIKDYDGIVNRTDLETYTLAIKDALHIYLDSWDVYSVSPPGSGAVLALILNILEGYDLTPESISNNDRSVLTYHRMIEAFKFAYAKRSALGDEDYVEGLQDFVAEMISQEYADEMRDKITDDKTHTYEYYEPAFLNDEDSGTSHVSVVDADGSACSATSTINLYFGSKVVGSRTGIIFNDEMDDFSQPGAENYFGVPPSPSNFIVPGKRPMSSMTPTIIIDGLGDVMQVQGASGGTRITTAVATAIMYTKWLGVDLESAIERPRIHDQLVPTEAKYEAGFNSNIVERLRDEKGHNMTVSTSIAVVQGIMRLEDDWYDAHSDTRKGGWPAGY